MNQLEEARLEKFHAKIRETIDTLIQMGNGKIVTQSMRATITAYYVGRLIRIDIREKELAGENGEEPS